MTGCVRDRGCMADHLCRCCCLVQVVRIVELAAPEMYQHICLDPLAHPDIQPTFIPCDPNKPQAQDDAAQQADQGQAQAPAQPNA